MNPVIIKEISKTVRLGYSGKQTSFDSFTAKFPDKKVYDMPAVGKDSIINVDAVTPDEVWQTEADALITKNPNNLLALKAADCIPLILYVPNEQILALAHVGTSGAALHLPAKVIKKLIFPPNQIHVYVGPHISQQSYRFPDRDISGKKLDNSWADYITHEPDGTHINLLGYVLNDLKQAGIKAKNIEVDDIDTGSDSNYFSHRRHKLTGEPNGRNCFAACLFE
jgi:copper oxidase (laccase) domain-containing protein